MSDATIKAALADYSRRLHARGWVANHDGNITVRLGPERYLATPTATSKAEIRAETTLVVDEGGAKVSGHGKPFSEIGLHLTVFRNRPDVQAVIHAHPPTATGFACAGVRLERPIIAEAVVSLGVGVPTVPFAPPGAAACEALAPFTQRADAVLLENHGVLAWGTDLEQAYLRLELVEHLAKITLVARQLGGERAIPERTIPVLLEARAKAGLMREAPPPKAASPATSSTPQATGARPVVIACAPGPSDAPVEVADPKRGVRSTTLPAPGELAAIIRQEIASVLGKK
jgi:L-fuculose-phosphate aldolase